MIKQDIKYSLIFTFLFLGIFQIYWFLTYPLKETLISESEEIYIDKIYENIEMKLDKKIETKENIELEVAEKEQESTRAVYENIIKEEKQKLKNYEKENLEYRYKIVFDPYSFEDKLASNYVKTLDYSLEKEVLGNKINKLDIFLKEEDLGTRGKMKNRSIYLFSPESLSLAEFLSVFVHEYGHYIDLYFFEKKILWDKSDKFYDISWESTQIKKAWQELSDFVSGYSMTNKYEDFAESFTYYMLHNKDFLVKSQNSSILQKKYNFFREELFQNWEFERQDFSLSDEIKDYYRDTTKINISLENFLKYLKNS